MRTKEETKVLRERAVELRLAGKSLREIKEILGPMSNTTLHNALKGTPPPDWTRRPNAKDDVRAQARELRAQGLAYQRSPPAWASLRVRFPCGSATCPSRIDSPTSNAGNAQPMVRTVTGQLSERSAEPGALVRCRPRRTR